MPDSIHPSPDHAETGDDALRALAGEADVNVNWTGNDGQIRAVGVESLRAILAAMGMECGSGAEIGGSRARLREENLAGALRPMITAWVGEPIEFRFHPGQSAHAQIEFEHGGAAGRAVERAGGGMARIGAVSRIGYHRLVIGGQTVTLAVAPRRCWSTGDAAPGERLWGLTAQTHALRRAGDGGIGDFGAVARLAEGAARLRADALSLSPSHALFGADDNHYTPYSPSSRLFLNTLLADPAAAFSADRIARARAVAGNPGDLARLEACELIDWPGASQARRAVIRALYEDFRDCEAAKPGNPLAADLARFRARGGEALEKHAIFEALHAKQFRRDFTKWLWREWPAELRDCGSPIVRGFAAANANEVSFHIFAQWLADRSLRDAQSAALAAGMRIGLISDLAIGMNAGGSQAWSAPGDVLLGLSIGAPPDPLAPRGQNWGLTTFSPRALAATGYAPFLATLRAVLRHAGGVRVDHVMGIARLWLTPNGMEASEGAYLNYPVTDMLRLIALESHRHQAIVIGEDLGTVPDGLREKLADAAVMGMRVMQFECGHNGFNPPDWYPANAAAMTSTHDTATTAGYWSGHDLSVRAAADQLPPGQSLDNALGERAGSRAALWSAFRNAGVTDRHEQPSPRDPSPAVDAAVGYMARTPASLVLLPLEDALGVVEQPNLPGTMLEHPNWRRRYQGQVDVCLDHPGALHRLRPLIDRR